MDDIQYMKRALELSEFCRGTTSPNPMVGCVIVHGDKVIGEGWTQPYGQAHAEVQAINNVSERSLLTEATAYVTLEPCAHYGKTPPCADLLINNRLKRVVIGTIDSNPAVGGKGVARLKGAGIEVEVGVLEAECRAMNIRFFTSIEKHRPYIILKWAQTADGFVAHENFSSKWISGPESRVLVHQWRAEEDAIMVGTNTAHYDNPRLDVRDWSGKNPVRIAIDKNLRLALDLNLFDGSQPTLVYNEEKDESHHHLDYIRASGDDYLSFILTDLHKRNIQSIIIEGGSTLLNSFLERNLWDEARVFTAEVNFVKGIKAPLCPLSVNSKTNIGTDVLEIYRNTEPSELEKS